MHLSGGQAGVRREGQLHLGEQVSHGGAHNHRDAAGPAVQDIPDGPKRALEEQRTPGAAVLPGLRVEVRSAGHECAGGRLERRVVGAHAGKSLRKKLQQLRGDEHAFRGKRNAG